MPTSLTPEIVQYTMLPVGRGAGAGDSTHNCGGVCRIPVLAWTWYDFVREFMQHCRAKPSRAPGFGTATFIAVCAHRAPGAHKQEGFRRPVTVNCRVHGIFQGSKVHCDKCYIIMCQAYTQNSSVLP